MISMPSTHGISEAMCGAVIWPLMRDATWFSVVNIRCCFRYGSSSRTSCRSR